MDVQVHNKFDDFLLREFNGKKLLACYWPRFHKLKRIRYRSREASILQSRL